MGINIPLTTAFAVSHLLGGVFIFISFQEPFGFLSYFFSNPLIIVQCVIQSPIICIFFAVAFVIQL
jgi:hypothetical protein